MAHGRQAVEPAFKPLSPCTRMYIGPHRQLGSPFQPVYMGVHASKKPAFALRIAAIGALKQAHFQAVLPAGRIQPDFCRVHRCTSGRNASWARPSSRCTWAYMLPKNPLLRTELLLQAARNYGAWPAGRGARIQASITLYTHVHRAAPPAGLALPAGVHRRTCIHKTHFCAPNYQIAAICARKPVPFLSGIQTYIAMYNHVHPCTSVRKSWYGGIRSFGESCDITGTPHQPTLRAHIEGFRTM
jgi:hypothetical protein